MSPRSCKSATCCVPMCNVCPFRRLCQGKIGLFASKLPKYTRLHLVTPFFLPNLSSQHYTDPKFSISTKIHATLIDSSNG
ncbi:hypothetical protein Hanom_Chr12g01088141 [Helianthus anomalus]